MQPSFNKNVCHPDPKRSEAEGPAFEKACHPSNQACHPDAERSEAEGSAFRSHKRTTFFLRTAQALALAVAVCFTLGATDAPGKRIDTLGRQLMCTCGCAQLLGECDHAGCQNRGEELDLLRAGVASGDSDKKIFDSFAAKYGAVVLAAPPASGFNLVAWIAPFAVFAAALLGTILLVRHWKVGRAEPVANISDPEMNALRDRIRRETGEEGGY